MFSAIFVASTDHGSPSWIVLKKVAWARKNPGTSCDVYLREKRGALLTPQRFRFKRCNLEQPLPAQCWKGWAKTAPLQSTALRSAPLFRANIRHTLRATRTAFHLNSTHSYARTLPFWSIGHMHYTAFWLAFRGRLVRAPAAKRGAALSGVSAGGPRVPPGLLALLRASAEQSGGGHLHGCAL